MARWRLLWTLPFFLSCGDGDPAGPDTSYLEILAVQGDGQGAEPGTPLPLPFVVRVQSPGNEAPMEGIRVRWELTAGMGASLDASVSRTDSLGFASARLTLGSSLGTYRVRASVSGQSSPPADFSAEALRMPAVTGLSVGQVRPGEVLTIQGRNFGIDPQDNEVTFSHVRGRVLSSSSDELLVEAPSCLLAREYELRVHVGSLVTEPVPLVVDGSPDPLDLDPAEDRILDASVDPGCVFLAPEAGAVYLVVPHSTATVSSLEHPFSLVTLAADGRVPVPPEAGGAPGVWSLQPAAPALVEAPGHPVPDAVLEARDRWDEHVRQLESELVKEWRSGAGPVGQGLAGPEGSSDEPVIGDRRTFKVLNRENDFEKITARVRYISDHAVIFMDEDVPPGGFSNSDLSSLADEFDAAIHPEVTENFGTESDIDENGRIIILFTAAVNRLTGSGSDGYVGGFFFGLDLLSGRSGSNGGEIFYSIVPDPGGEEGPAIARHTALGTIPAVLAHEFEHMVHFNRRMLLGGAESTEALWLSEALAQMAEDLVGQAYLEAQRPEKALQYHNGNWARARRFLEESSQVSVLASRPPGTLAERGAGWLLLKQVRGLHGQGTILKTMASSTLSGISNLTGATGLSWPEIVSNWSGSLFLDGTGLPVRSELEVSGVNLRYALASTGGYYPLQPMSLGQATAAVSGTLWSSAPAYFIISPPSGGLTLAVGGDMGARPEPGLGLRTLVVRLQ